MFEDSYPLPSAELLLYNEAIECVETSDYCRPSDADGWSLEDDHEFWADAFEEAE